MDLVTEKSQTLSRAGSFWYKTLTESDRKTAHAVTGVAMLSTVPEKLQNCVTAALSGGYFTEHYTVVRFGKSDVGGGDIDTLLQRRDRFRTGTMGVAEDLTVAQGTLLDASRGEAVSTDTFDAVRFTVAGDEDLTISNAEPMYHRLTIDKDLLVMSIELDDGTILHNGMDYLAGFGTFEFQESPIKLFPRMQFMAKSAIRRVRNIYNYTLSLGDVCGPVDRILHYYRTSQTVRTLERAAAQAAGFPVVRVDCEVTGAVPLLNGWQYKTTGGCYDAPFPHTQLPKGAKLQDGTIIGAKGLFEMYGGDDAIPSDLGDLHPHTALPVGDLIIPNRTITLYVGTTFRPDYTPTYAVDVGYKARLEAYWSLLADIVQPTGAPTTGNGVAHFLGQVRNNYIIVRINESAVDNQMILKLKRFIERERMVGTVLLYSPIAPILS